MGVRFEILQAVQAHEGQYNHSELDTGGYSQEGSNRKAKENEEGWLGALEGDGGW